MFRHGAHGLEVLLAHPGGPFFRNKDAGAWTLPKGELDEGEEPLACALREFAEETGITPGEGPFLDLGEVQQKGGKRVRGFAFEQHGALPDGPPPSNTFEMEWPPRSGKRVSFPEIDRMELFSLHDAQAKILAAQSEFLVRLEAALRGRT